MSDMHKKKVWHIYKLHKYCCFNRSSARNSKFTKRTCQFFLNMIKYWLSNIYSYLILDVKQASVRKEIFKVASKKRKYWSTASYNKWVSFVFCMKWITREMVWCERKNMGFKVWFHSWPTLWSWASQDPSLSLHFHNKTKAWNYIIYLTGLLWGLNKVMYMKETSLVLGTG